MKIIKTLLMIVVLTVFLCCSSSKTKETSKEITTTEAVVKNDTSKNAGYTKGTIVFSNKPDDCAYTIRIDGKDNVLYDPTNLDEKYQRQDEKVWFTFSPLRRMNRCEKANPIYITDIKKQ